MLKVKFTAFAAKPSNPWLLEDLPPWRTSHVYGAGLGLDSWGSEESSRRPPTEVKGPCSRNVSVRDNADHGTEPAPARTRGGICTGRARARELHLPTWLHFLLAGQIARSFNNRP
ncbi:hypothetical protein AAFF_G00165050 [Aldrovandia affinis]|uniref:Uncharacterized protein n=1 Tax=Aldrovandia affinis TaxID=143900 RepID=A0AAD7W854_9TELE|nr:hypothetical protein AAFF_G00165050 [Aldrovandia affinis]